VFHIKNIDFNLKFLLKKDAFFKNVAKISQLLLVFINRLYMIVNSALYDNF